MARKRGTVDRYLYWSGRRMEQIATDNDISLDRARHFVIKTPAIAGFQAELDLDERTVTRAKIAHRLDRALGAAIVEDFSLVPPGHVSFARGYGSVNAAEYSGSVGKTPGTVLHTRIEPAAGGRVDLCLFGLMDNLAGFQRADAVPAGWSSSAWYAVNELLSSRGRKNTSQWDTEPERSLEALKIALEQGKNRGSTGSARTRGFTLGHTGSAQWLAEIYTDVILDSERRRDLDGVFEGTERIMVGAPVWIRARHYTRYSGRGPARGIERLWSRRAGTLT